jgi:hypothetical protein
MLLVLAAGLVGYDLSRADDQLSARSVPPATEVVPRAAPPPTTPVTPVPAVVVQAGAGTFQFAVGDGVIAGSSGPILRYAVGVEDGAGVDSTDFAVAVEAILSDPRSWTAGGTVRLQRVAETSAPDFTVYLATPVTSEGICREEWLETGQYTNCRLSDHRVVINAARWLTSVPNYGAPLAAYQAYAINHEVGHELGQGHEMCPAPGQPAPVMQPQTEGLDGCVAYGWPYRDGARYEGPASDK